MSTPTLSIVIPTYERPEFLIRTVASILPQLGPAVTLTILDNASPTPATTALKDVFRESIAPVRIIRHSENIGGNANITRCLELSEGHWVWILGDDDPVLPGAVGRVLELIAAATPEVGLICCRSDKTGPLAWEPVRRLSELRSRITYDDFLFISTKILRTQFHRPHLAAAYHWCGAYAPQVALYLSALATGRSSIIFADVCIVEQTIQPSEARWSYLHFLLTSGSIFLLPRDPRDQRHLAQWIAACQFYRPLKVLAHLALLVPTIGQRRAFVRVIAGTVYAHSPGRRLLFAAAAPLFILAPWLANAVTRSHLRRSGQAIPTRSDRTT